MTSYRKPLSSIENLSNRTIINIEISKPVITPAKQCSPASGSKFDDLRRIVDNFVIDPAMSIQALKIIKDIESEFHELRSDFACMKTKETVSPEHHAENVIPQSHAKRSHGQYPMSEINFESRIATIGQLNDRPVMLDVCDGESVNLAESTSMLVNEVKSESPLARPVVRRSNRRASISAFTILDSLQSGGISMDKKPRLPRSKKPIEIERKEPESISGVTMDTAQQAANNYLLTPSEPSLIVLLTLPIISEPVTSSSQFDLGDSPSVPKNTELQPVRIESITDYLVFPLENDSILGYKAGSIPCRPDVELDGSLQISSSGGHISEPLPEPISELHSESPLMQELRVLNVTIDDLCISDVDSVKVSDILLSEPPLSDGQATTDLLDLSEIYSCEVTSPATNCFNLELESNFLCMASLCESNFTPFGSSQGASSCPSPSSSPFLLPTESQDSDDDLLSALDLAAVQPARGARAARGGNSSSSGSRRQSLRFKLKTGAFLDQQQEQEQEQGGLLLYEEPKKTRQPRCKKEAVTSPSESVREESEHLCAVINGHHIPLPMDSDASLAVVQPGGDSSDALSVLTPSTSEPASVGLSIVSKNLQSSAENPENLLDCDIPEETAQSALISHELLLMTHQTVSECDFCDEDAGDVGSLVSDSAACSAESGVLCDKPLSLSLIPEEYCALNAPVTPTPTHGPVWGTTGSTQQGDGDGDDQQRYQELLQWCCGCSEVQDPPEPTHCSDDSNSSSPFPSSPPCLDRSSEYAPQAVESSSPPVIVERHDWVPNPAPMITGSELLSSLFSCYGDDDGNDEDEDEDEDDVVFYSDRCSTETGRDLDSGSRLSLDSCSSAETVLCPRVPSSCSVPRLVPCAAPAEILLEEPLCKVPVHEITVPLSAGDASSDAETPTSSSSTRPSSPALLQHYSRGPMALLDDSVTYEALTRSCSLISSSMDTNHPHSSSSGMGFTVTLLSLVSALYPEGCSAPSLEAYSSPSSKHPTQTVPSAFLASLASALAALVPPLSVSEEEVGPVPEPVENDRMRRVRFCGVDGSSVPTPTHSTSHCHMQCAARRLQSLLVGIDLLITVLQEWDRSRSDQRGVGLGAVLRCCEMLAVRGTAECAAQKLQQCLSVAVDAADIACIGDFMVSELTAATELQSESPCIALTGVRTTLRQRTAWMSTAMVRAQLRWLLDPPPTMLTARTGCQYSPSPFPRCSAFEVVELKEAPRAYSNRKGARLDTAPTVRMSLSYLLTLALRQMYDAFISAAESLLVLVRGTEHLFVTQLLVAAVTTSSDSSGGSTEAPHPMSFFEGLEAVQPQLALAADRARAFVHHVLSFPALQAIISIETHLWATVRESALLLGQLGMSEDRHLCLLAGGWDGLLAFSQHRLLSEAAEQRCVQYVGVVECSARARGALSDTDALLLNSSLIYTFPSLS